MGVSVPDLQATHPAGEASTEETPLDHLSIAEQRHPEATVITLTGDLSAYTTPVLRSAVDGRRADDHLVIDLRDVRQLDASGLSVLVWTAEDRAGRGRRTGVVARDGMQRLFGYTRLRRTASIGSTVESAVGASPDPG